ncbi:hypothetical protein CDL12_20459 [Handroanthus impetiginosus]|uniref:Uncharacterized protein n=1 Tax=Handroanthus impetiginosus TaxID=429701 RepID=A0A2G9GPP8_9LAMI|nr:hypothetical protein CDL12_20459 [Handroanthus impetiginosus]
MKTRQVKATLDLRYPSTLRCDYNLMVAIREVESSRKPSKGKLFCCCAHQRCHFFSWGAPQTVTRSPNGFPIRYPNEGNESFSYAEVGGYSEVEEEGCYVEVSSAPVPVFNQDANINNSRILWIFSVALFFIVVLLLLKM